jgi:hypothetical protein
MPCILDLLDVDLEGEGAGKWATFNTPMACCACLMTSISLPCVSIATRQTYITTDEVLMYA